MSLVFSFLFFSFLVLSFLFFSCLVLSCLVLSCLVLSLVLSCLLSCLVWSLVFFLPYLGLCLVLVFVWSCLCLLSQPCLVQDKARETRNTPTFGLTLGFLGFIWRCIVFEIPYGYDAHAAKVDILCCAGCVVFLALSGLAW
jgi:hypothetical protein